MIKWGINCPSREARQRSNTTFKQRLKQDCSEIVESCQFCLFPPVMTLQITLTVTVSRHTVDDLHLFFLYLTQFNLTAQLVSLCKLLWQYVSSKR